MLTCSSNETIKLQQLFSVYQLKIIQSKNNIEIPGSFWGDSEAGLINNHLYVRPDTPLHSALHEACHYICMDTNRRDNLNTNAGGDYDEENAVCYLQIIFSDHIPGYNQKTIFSDMDKWGYSFRLGSSQRWFEEDAEDAQQWLIDHGIINQDQHPLWQLRIK